MGQKLHIWQICRVGKSTNYFLTGNHSSGRNFMKTRTLNSRKFTLWKIKNLKFPTSFLSAWDFLWRMSCEIKFPFLCRKQPFQFWWCYHSHKISELNPNNSFFFVMPNYLVDRTLTELNPNNSRILQFFIKFYELFANFSHNFLFLFFLLSCKTETSDPNNSK